MSANVRQKLAASLTKELRTVKDKASLMVFIQRIDQQEFALYLYRNRRRHWCFDFTDHPYKKGYAHYLMDDGVSTGTCKWENLYRVLVVR